MLIVIQSWSPIASQPTKSKRYAITAKEKKDVYLYKEQNPKERLDDISKHFMVCSSSQTDTELTIQF